MKVIDLIKDASGFDFNVVYFGNILEEDVKKLISNMDNEDCVGDINISRLIDIIQGKQKGANKCVVEEQKKSDK